MIRLEGKQELTVSQIDAVIASLNEQHARDWDAITQQLSLVHDAIKVVAA